MIRLSSVLAVLALSIAPAIAQDSDAKIQMGQGLMCDTAEQAVRFGQLSHKGDLNVALATVNTEASKPTACGVASVAFLAGEEIGRVRNESGVETFRIVRIMVVGIRGPAGVQRVKPLEQFALVPSKTVAI